MPQLDKVTFLSQFFWLCFFYLGFYYLVVKYFLPKISRILTLRQKKMNLSQYGGSSLQQENQQVRENLDSILSRGLSLSRNVFNDFFSRTNNWLHQSLTGVNKTHYNTVNNSYVQSIGENSLSQNILLYHASTQSSHDLKVCVFVNRLKNLRKAPGSPLAFKLQKSQPLLEQDVTKKKSRKSKKDIQ